MLLLTVLKWGTGGGGEGHPAPPKPVIGKGVYIKELQHTKYNQHGILFCYMVYLTQVEHIFKF